MIVLACESCVGRIPLCHKCVQLLFLKHRYGSSDSVVCGTNVPTIDPVCGPGCTFGWFFMGNDFDPGRCHGMRVEVMYAKEIVVGGQFWIEAELCIACLRFLSLADQAAPQVKWKVVGWLMIDQK
jgi:hypothetical protein